ncbi:two-component system response regulator PmrA [Gilliamella sp. B2776]|uniref:two-component system response regulator PmrA n=1 Tax=unclassified Gilliamella TaxID=2685620 RepID=UPI00226A5CC3|nr:MULTISPECIES: two-component system response regulator PmrA [unclassified Gilliamella]MCX8649190.1 two-component system response regulator PmrA [Gilliamella sp. B2779]MCX8652934.1 two-component system response regulator PmrA [Gilliamella sp. B2737]MCX8655196.1 two-component system response regulator PmrA [Gilliamella sp. B2894]MCX8691002.1 two-component system response regulator PmrA [Gilliamella sp. B2776]MCX8694488.1 two-component system response regulator PmrA [Gilliamella sp. B2881]
MKILIVEDDSLLQKGLYDGITSNNYVCEIASTGKQAEQFIQFGQFSLIILDLGLPDCDGLELLTRWRKKQIDTPVLILTARDTIEDRVEGLDLGADDYLIKPFALTELLARVRALIRRNQGTADNLISYSSITIDIKQQKVTLNNEEIILTPKEFIVLSRLMLKAGEKVHRDLLQNDLYDWQSDPSSNVLEVYIHGLRNKLGKNFIRTVRGYGYQLSDGS